MAYWMKLGYFKDLPDEGSVEYWLERTWINDGPGLDSSRWKQWEQPLAGEQYPTFGPQYERGDKIVIYTRGEGCQAVHEVREAPVWDPDEIVARGAVTDVRRWAVLTETKPLCAVDRAHSVALDEFEVPSSAVGQKGWISLTRRQYELARAALDGRESRLAPRVDIVVLPDSDTQVEWIPIEQTNVREFEVLSEREIATAARRESALVTEFRDYLVTKGHEVRRFRANPEGGGRWIYCDLFVDSRNLLIEAKATALRSDIRMAIGQLADYARFAKNKGVRKGVLTEDRPSDDLVELLEKEKIAAIWREGDGFADSAGGVFT